MLLFDSTLSSKITLNLINEFKFEHFIIREKIFNENE